MKSCHVQIAEIFFLRLSQNNLSAAKPCWCIAFIAILLRMLLLVLAQQYWPIVLVKIYFAAFS